MDRKKWVYIGIILFILIFLGYFLIFHKKTCYDDSCFDSSMSVCSPVKYKKVLSNSLYLYDVSRSFETKCKIEINLLKMADGTELELRQKLEGKSMICKVPKQNLQILKISETENLLKYCTGPLKEGLYEALIKKMYTIIVANLGDILTEIQKDIILQV